MHVTFVRYSWNNQGIFLYSIFLEHYFGIFPGNSWGIFSEYAGNIAWECSANISRTYICPVGVVLCNKIKINESERFTQARMGICMFTLLSESYIQKKTIVLHRFTQNLEISSRQVDFKEN